MAFFIEYIISHQASNDGHTAPNSSVTSTFDNFDIPTTLATTTNEDSTFASAARTAIIIANGGPFANPFNESGIYLNDSQISSVDSGPFNAQKSMALDFDTYDDVFKAPNDELDRTFNGSLAGINFSRPVAAANPFNCQASVTISEPIVAMSNAAPSMANYDAFRFLAMDTQQQTLPIHTKSPAPENGTATNVVKTVVDSNLFMDAAANAFLVFGKSPSNNCSPKKHENFDRNVEWNCNKNGKVNFYRKAFCMCCFYM